MSRLDIFLCALAGFSVGAAISEPMTGRDVFTYLIGMLFGMFAEQSLVGRFPKERTDG